MRITALMFLIAGCWTSSTKSTEPTEPPPSDAAVATPHHPPPPLDEMEVAIQRMSEFKDAMCQCTTTQCAQLVADDMTKWSQDLARDSHDPPKLDDEQSKRATQIGEEMGKCMMKAMSPPTGSVTP